jgi:hypothetical protein
MITNIIPSVGKELTPGFCSNIVGNDFQKTTIYYPDADYICET